MIANFVEDYQFIRCCLSIDAELHRSRLNVANASDKYVEGTPTACTLVHRLACEIPAIYTSTGFISRNLKFSIISGVFLLVLYACYGVWKHRRLQKDGKDPKTWPILGSQLEATRNYDRLIDWITSYFSDDHRTVKMSFLSRRSYLTVDPANVEHILKTNFHNYPKGEESHFRLYDLLGSGILNTDGSMWKSHRKLGSLEFSIKKLRHLTSTVYKSHALSLLETLEVSSQRDIDMQELLLNMTFNSICEVVFGSDVQASVCEDASIASALDNVQEMITRRYVFPWWRLQKLFNLGSERILHQEITRFNAFLTHVIRCKQSQIRTTSKAATSALSTNETKTDNNESIAQDLLSRFILHQKKENRDDADAEKAVREAMMSFVMAGRDTTASTLSWFLYCMCTHPHIQERVLEELINLENNCNDITKGPNNEVKLAADPNEEKSGICSSCNKSRADDMREFSEKVLSYESLQSSSTPYLHAALAETLRLYPAVPRDGKVALRDDVLPDGTLLKPGDQVAYIPYSMGRMPFLWGDDANLFKPERWISNGHFQPQSPFKFTAFQAGPRMCLGKDAAYLQMKITAALLLRFFHFMLVPNHPIEYRMMMVMTMKYGVKVHVNQR